VAVVGAGAGGIVAAAYLARAGHDVLLLEAKDKVGGCASNFAVGGFTFLAGATTLVGLEPHMPLGRVLAELAFRPEVEPLRGALAVHHAGRSFALAPDTGENVERLGRLYGAPFGAFWGEAARVAGRAWGLVTDAPLPPASVGELAALARNRRAWECLPWLLKTGASALRDAGCHDARARELLDELLLISTQAPSRDTPALFAALGVEYLERTLYWARGGLGGFLEALAARATELGAAVRRSTPVARVERARGGWRLTTEAGETFDAEAVVLDLTHWDAARLCAGEPGAFFGRAARRHAEGWATCTLYAGVRDVFDENERVYHQIVPAGPLPTSGAHSAFVTVAPRSDPTLAPPGARAITVSCHTRAEAWFALGEAELARAKEALERELWAAVVRALPALEGVEPAVRTTATPRTWLSFTGRSLGRVGGLPLTRATLARGYPTGLTPFAGLARVGDTVFPGQSVVAVAWGARRVTARLVEALKAKAA
jgi:phytoene dehydrogenase-like protein